MQIFSALLILVFFLKQIKQISKTNSYCSGLKIGKKRLTLNPLKWTTGLNNWMERMLREITSPQFISLLHHVSGSQRLSLSPSVTTSPELIKDDESLECSSLEGVIENTNQKQTNKKKMTHTTGPISSSWNIWMTPFRIYPDIRETKAIQNQHSLMLLKFSKCTIK